MTTDATRAHIDAETLAAWADRGLPADAAAAVELHLSNCDRCQEMLAAFVRSAPTSGAVVIPFWGRRPVQWSAAGLAAAAALVAMVWIGRPPAPPAPVSTVAVQDAAPTAPHASVDQIAPPAEPRQEKSASGAQERSASAADLLRDRPSSTGQDRAVANQVAKKMETGRAAAAAPPPAPAGAMAPPPPPPAITMPPTTVTAAAPVVTPVITPAVTPLGATRPAAMSEIVAMDAFSKVIPIIEFAAPDPSSPALRSTAGAAGRGGVGARALSEGVAPTRWRIVAGARVERSLDNGATWNVLPIEPELKTPLLAGAATSQSNCWLVGRDGVVLVTHDGRTFRRVSVPEAVHLTGVTATDGMRATVTALDGRTFSTIDGGLTWK